MEHDSLIIKEFTKQAKDFANEKLSMNNQNYIHWIVQSLNLNKQMIVLDVAAGTGILSRAIAPYVERVISFDLSNEMIKEGEIQNNLHDIHNIQYIQGHVEQLPFEEGTFDLVISRFAYHHFVHPDRVLTEMNRVCKLQSDVAVIDMISQEDDLLFEQFNHYERLRDPSHTYALKKSQFDDLFIHKGFDIHTEDILQVPIYVNTWMELTKTEEKIANDIREALILEIESGEAATGMFPYLDKEELMFE